MDIYKEQITAIIGPSGCGKSTFIKSLNRISELEGKVRIEVMFWSWIFMTPRQPEPTASPDWYGVPKPNPSISIYDNVAYGVRVAGRRARELDVIGICPKVQLSGMR